MDGTASAGVANMYSRQDHIHPTDTSRQRKLKEVTVSISASSTEAQIGSITDADINENMQCIHSEIENAVSQLSDWTVTTYSEAPQLRITGKSASATTAKLILAEIV